MKDKTKSKTSNFKKNNRFRVGKSSDLEDYEAPKKWFEGFTVDVKCENKVTEQVLIDLKDEAMKCYNAEAASYISKNAKSNSNFRWMKTMMSKGTVSDKIAAYTVAIQNNPLYSLDTLRNVVGMVKVGKKKECIAVIETLTELFLEELLIPDGKLRAFHQRPLGVLNELSSGNTVTRRKYLCAWYFEDQLKEVYTTFVLALNTAAHDTVESNKEKAISAMYKLLAGNPEQEKNLLSYIVNKLGDPSQKVASKTIYCLTQLLRKHPNMQGVVLSEVEKLMFRSNISTRAQYYGLCFLSQFYLSHEDSEIARRLIEVYFSFFKACIKKGDVDSRMMSALLMGVNRAYPYAKLALHKVSEHLDTMYKVVHLANFSVSLHALCLLYQVSDCSSNINDRFYSALYKKLFDSKVSTTTHQAMLLNLVYKALLRDKETNRVIVFVKRLLQLALYTAPCFSCGILFLVSQLIMKKPEIQAFVSKQSSINMEDEGNEEEKYEDVMEDPSDMTKVESEKNPQKDSVEDVSTDDKSNSVATETNTTASWFHSANVTLSEKKHNILKYNPFNRNPLYGGGEFCAYVELLHLRNHFHPSVNLFAEQILKGESIKYSGDPLKDFTLIRFLDRFVFKNPKKPDELEKQGSHPTFGKRKVYQPKGVKSLRVNTIAYMNEKEQNIPVDEIFLYTYLQRRFKDKLERSARDDEEDQDSDVESVASEEFEEMLYKMSFIPKEDEDLDYLTDVGDKLRKKANSDTTEKEDDENDFERDDIDLDDEVASESDELSDNAELSGDETFKDSGNVEGDEDLFNDEDEELIRDLDDDEMSDIVFDSDDEENTSSKKGKKKQPKLDLSSVFASAEEFASILEDEGSSFAAPGTSNVISNKDNANAKQLMWEEKRNRWLQGYNKALGKKTNRFSLKGHKANGFKRKHNKDKGKAEGGLKKKRRRF